MNELVQIMDQVIQEGFPDLLGQSIGIRYKRLDPDTILQVDLGDDGDYDYELLADPCMRRAPRIAKVGGVAHELHHVTDWVRMPRAERKLDDKMYARSDRYKTLDERNTDLGVIMRGYGPHILALEVYSDSIGRFYHRTGGLSRHEIVRLLAINGSEGSRKHVDQRAMRELNRMLKRKGAAPK